MAEIVLVLGGARSGKSRYAERSVLERGGRAVYVATGRAWDEEMRDRIDLHVRRRGDEWHNVEEPIALETALRRHVGNADHALVDCLTMWITNLMMEDRDTDAAFDDLLHASIEIPGSVTFVSNEVGLGIVPTDAMARRFRDLAGSLHQRIAEQARAVHFVTAGLAQRIK